MTRARRRQGKRGVRRLRTPRVGSNNEGREKNKTPATRREGEPCGWRRGHPRHGGGVRGGQSFPTPPPSHRPPRHSRAAAAAGRASGPHHSSCARGSHGSPAGSFKAPTYTASGGGGGARGVARVGRAVAAVGRQTPLPGGVAAVSAAGRRGAVAATAPLPVRIAHRAGWRDCQSGGAARTGKTSGRGWSWKLVENVEDAGLMGMGIAWAWRRAGASGRQEEPGR